MAKVIVWYMTAKSSSLVLPLLWCSKHKPELQECWHMFVFLFFHMTLSTYPKTMEVDGRPLYFKSIVDRREMFKAIFKPISQRAHKVVFQQRAPTEGSYRLWLYGVVGTKRDLKLHTSCNREWLTKSPASSVCLICCWPARHKPFAFSKKKKKKSEPSSLVNCMFTHTRNLTLVVSCSIYLHAMTLTDIQPLLSVKVILQLNTTCILCTSDDSTNTI